MYLPNAQSVIVAGLALTGTMTKRKYYTTPHHSPTSPPLSNPVLLQLTRHTAKEVASGSVMDYAIEKCLDADQNIRCTKPFLVAKDTCYKLEWSTEGVLSHTTVEVRDAGSSEIVFYRDTNGEWTPEKGEVC